MYVLYPAMKWRGVHQTPLKKLELQIPWVFGSPLTRRLMFGTALLFRRGLSANYCRRAVLLLQEASRSVLYTVKSVIDIFVAGYLRVRWVYPLQIKV